MKCPDCPESILVMSDRQGVEIDYCPQCRGVWLDRGELDKLIERSASVPAERGSSQAPRQDDRGYHDRGHHYGRRHKSWLSEIFD
jgi:Zn-finger nucleic acid-binding protein